MRARFELEPVSVNIPKHVSPEFPDASFFKAAVDMFQQGRVDMHAPIPPDYAIKLLLALPTLNLKPGTTLNLRTIAEAYGLSIDEARRVINGSAVKIAYAVHPDDLTECHVIAETIKGDTEKSAKRTIVEILTQRVVRIQGRTEIVDVLQQRELHMWKVQDRREEIEEIIRQTLRKKYPKSLTTGGPTIGTPEHVKKLYEILRLKKLGVKNKHIARILSSTQKTVESCSSDLIGLGFLEPNHHNGHFDKTVEVDGFVAQERNADPMATYAQLAHRLTIRIGRKVTARQVKSSFNRQFKDGKDTIRKKRPVTKTLQELKELVARHQNNGSGKPLSKGVLQDQLGVNSRSYLHRLLYAAGIDPNLFSSRPVTVFVRHSP